MNYSELELDFSDLTFRTRLSDSNFGLSFSSTIGETRLHKSNEISGLEPSRSVLVRCLLIPYRITVMNNQIDKALAQLRSSSLASVINGLRLVADLSEEDGAKRVQLGATGTCRGIVFQLMLNGQCFFACYFAFIKICEYVEL